MQPVIDKISREDILRELTPERFVRFTNFGHNEIFIFRGDDAPALMQEVGRLREIAFREAGGGTGYPVDIDDFDNGPDAYYQLIVWNPIEKEIVGGYRYIKLKDVKRDEHGHYHLATTHMFRFSEKFMEEYFHDTIELGRSFVQPQYQASRDSRKGIFSLDNLWDGLGGLIIMHPDIKYFYGKVTMYLKYDQLARDVIMSFLMKYFPDRDNLVWAYVPRPIRTTDDVIRKILCGKSYEEDKTLLLKFVRSRGMVFPPLVNAYMNLTSSMRTFGSSLNDTFGEVEEIGILVTISDIYDSKKHRHLASFYKGRE
jgi:hypothetical protein